MGGGTCSLQFTSSALGQCTGLSRMCLNATNPSRKKFFFRIALAHANAFSKHAGHVRLQITGMQTSCSGSFLPPQSVHPWGWDNPIPNFWDPPAPAVVVPRGMIAPWREMFTHWNGTCGEQARVPVCTLPAEGRRPGGRQRTAGSP